MEIKTIKITSQKHALPGTNLLKDVTQILQKTGMDDPKVFTMDASKPLMIIQTTSAALAEALRSELPRRGYNIAESQDS